VILAIDQGTTGSKCIVFDEGGEPVGRAYSEFGQHFPRPGWVEHDLEEIWEVTQAVAGRALEDAGVRPGELLAVGITNQRETVCAWDPASGKPLHKAIVWQDRRTAARCEELRAAGMEELVRERTGLVLDPYFSATKMQWLLEQVPGLRERAESGGAVLGTIDSWLAFKLTGEHITDASNASRTMLYDLARGDWDAELLELFGIPRRALPRVCASAGLLGETRAEALHGHSVPLAGMAGDQQAALFGQACLTPGMGKNTYGTGSFVLLNTGTEAPAPASGLLGTVAWDLEVEGAAQGDAGGPAGERSSETSREGAAHGDAGAGRRTYALEASIFVTGAAVQWLRDGLGIVERASDSQALAETLDGNEGVYFVPALTGLGSPHWDAGARGTIVGLTRGSGRAHLARAALEAMAYQSLDAVRAMESACGQSLRELRADGGASANEWLMQFQADVLGAPVVLAGTSETTALGAAYLAGLGVGLWRTADIAAAWREGARFEPRMGEGEREGLLAGWQAALAATRGIAAGTKA
jgi:glycerol kinase